MLSHHLRRTLVKKFPPLPSINRQCSTFKGDTEIKIKNTEKIAQKILNIPPEPQGMHVTRGQLTFKIDQVTNEQTLRAMVLEKQVLQPQIVITPTTRVDACRTKLRLDKTFGAFNYAIGIARRDEKIMKELKSIKSADIWRQIGLIQAYVNVRNFLGVFFAKNFKILIFLRINLQSSCVPRNTHRPKSASFVRVLCRIITSKFYLKKVPCGLNRCENRLPCRRASRKPQSFIRKFKRK